MVYREEYSVSTSAHDCFVNITSHVGACLSASGMSEGHVRVFVPHTTAAVTINENADPDVVHDLLKQLDELVPWRRPYFRHGEGNSAAHLKSSLVGCSVSIPVQSGRLLLGTWQAVYLAEFDGPRTRRVVVQVEGT